MTAINLQISLKKRKSKTLMLLVTNVSKIKITISSLGIKKRRRVRKAHYEQLLNVKFDWDGSCLFIGSSVEGPAIKITRDMVAEQY